MSGRAHRPAVIDVRTSAPRSFRKAAGTKSRHPGQTPAHRPSRRMLGPGNAVLSHRQPDREKLIHEGTIEWLGLYLGKGLGDPDGVELHAVPLGVGIHSVKIADTLRLDQGADGFSDNRHEPWLHRTVFRTDLAVADDIERPVPLKTGLFCNFPHRELRGEKKRLVARSPVDMHLVIRLSICHDLDIDWRKQAGNRR